MKICYKTWDSAPQEIPYSGTVKGVRQVVDVENDEEYFHRFPEDAIRRPQATEKGAAGGKREYLQKRLVPKLGFPIFLIAPLNLLVFQGRKG